MHIQSLKKYITPLVSSLFYLKGQRHMTPYGSVLELYRKISEEGGEIEI